MALLDELLGGVLRSALGGSGTGTAGSGKAALIQAVLAMLLQGGLGGGRQPQGAPGGSGGDLGSILGGLLGGGGNPAAGAPGGGSGDLGSILGGLLGGGSNPAANAAPGGGLGGALGGGLGGLGQILEQAGLGEHMKSWVSTGQNMPLSPDQVTQVFGHDRLGQLAEAAGMDQKDAADQLSQILPQLVDGMTPAGGLPQGDEVSQDDLGQLVSRVLSGR
ncbi:YidB family protein [Vineibacter terrae]|uniref:YidB family protein n=1 Tax=Vineibacter terrae TaxID=2586908 RepID=UPI002E31071C|nr:YidB family protein [Vineibacter terrae]HEX2891289.1 YidB family protein [Vineibacter terrae]